MAGAEPLGEISGLLTHACVMTFTGILFRGPEVVGLWIPNNEGSCNHTYVHMHVCILCPCLSCGRTFMACHCGQAGGGASPPGLIPEEPQLVHAPAVQIWVQHSFSSASVSSLVHVANIGVTCLHRAAMKMKPVTIGAGLRAGPSTGSTTGLR